MGRRRFYDCLSSCYGVVGLFDNYYKRMAVSGLMFPKGGRFLDLGCGDGYLLRYVKKDVVGADFFGADFSLKMALLASEGNGGRICAGDCFFLPFSSGSFDVLFSSFVFDIFSEDEQKMVLSEFYRVLGEGGVLVLVNNARGSGVFYQLSGFYVFLSRLFPGLLLNRPVDTCHVVGEVGGFSLQKRVITGFTEIAVFVKGS